MASVKTDAYSTKGCYQGIFLSHDNLPTSLVTSVVPGATNTLHWPSSHCHSLNAWAHATGRRHYKERPAIAAQRQAGESLQQAPENKKHQTPLNLRRVSSSRPAVGVRNCLQASSYLTLLYPSHFLKSTDFTAWHTSHKHKDFLCCSLVGPLPLWKMNIYIKSPETLKDKV